MALNWFIILLHHIVFFTKVQKPDFSPLRSSVMKNTRKHHSHWANKTNDIIMLIKKYINNIRQIWLVFWQGIAEWYRTVARADSYSGLCALAERNGSLAEKFKNKFTSKRVTLKKMEIKIIKNKTWTSWVAGGYTIRRIGIDFLVYFSANSFFSSPQKLRE